MKRVKVLVLLPLLIAVTAGCSHPPSDRTVVTITRRDGQKVNCIKPPPDVMESELAAHIDLSYPLLLGTLKGAASVGRKFERIRTEIPNLQAMEVFHYRLCVDWANGAISDSIYHLFLNRIIPPLSALLDASAHRQPNTNKQADIAQLVAGMLANFQEGFYDVADKGADDILALDRTNCRALNMKGSVAFYRGSYQIAIEYFTKALESLPENTPKTKSLSYAYTMNLADSYVEVGGYKRAIALYESVSHNTPEWSYAIGRAYMHAGQFSDALTYLQSVPSYNERGRARVLEAACLAGLSEIEHDLTRASDIKREATAKLREGIAQDPQYWNGILTDQLQDTHESHTMARGLLRELLKEMGLGSPIERQGDCCRQGPP